MSDVASTACSRCRGQKLKCSRELPQCARCKRLGANCEFPLPPDRKALAASRQPQQKRRKTTTTPPAPDELSGNSSVGTAVLIEDVDENDGPSLPLPLQKLLQDVYFTSMWNASFIFHRPTFEAAFESNYIPRHTLLALYASATMYSCQNLQATIFLTIDSFITPKSSILKQNMNLLRPLGDIRATGQRWAARAGHEALRDIDRPTISIIRTCKLLQLFWFAQGESPRNVMLNAVTYSAASILGLGLPRAVKLDANERCLLPIHKEDEAIRRLFWAIWIARLVNADIPRTSTDDEYTDDLPLPSSENVYLRSSEGQSQSPPTVRGIENGPSPSNELSPAAHILSLLSIWGDIRDLINSRKRNLDGSRLDKMFAIDRRVSSWLSKLPPSLQYSKRNLYEQLVVHSQPMYVLLHATYFQSRLVLYSSMVPLFSGLPAQERCTPELMAMSARVGLLNAQKISELGADFLALDCTTARLPAFVGYCMYVSASVQLVLLNTQDAGLAAQARTNLISNLKLLRAMKEYWSNIQRLWDRLSVLYELQLASPHGPINGEQSEASPGALEQLAGQKRYTGVMTEPLSDSVLQYTLHRLNPDVQSPPPPSGGDVLSRLIQEDFSSVSASLVGAGGGSQVPQVNPALVDRENVGRPTDHLAVPPSMYTNFDETADYYQWWPNDMESLQQTAFPDDHLFATTWYM